MRGGIPGFVKDEIICEIAGQLADVAPAAGVVGAPKGEAEGNEKVAGDDDAALHCGGGIVVQSTVGSLPIDFCEKDGLIGMEAPEIDYVMDKAWEGVAINEGGKGRFVQAVVE